MSDEIDLRDQDEEREEGETSLALDDDDLPEAVGGEEEEVESLDKLIEKEDEEDEFVDEFARDDITDY